MILNKHKYIQRSLLGIAIIIMMAIPDVLIELITEVLHIVFEILFEILDISFEWVESMLDHLIEHLFETELHETQTIVFYVIVSLLITPLYFLSRLFLRLSSRFYFYSQEKLFHSWTLNKNEVILFWSTSSLHEKIKWGLITLLSLYIASFFIM